MKMTVWPWVSAEWVVTSSQESWNPSSSGNCCFSGGKEFSSTKNKQIEVGKATSLGVAKAGNLKLDLMEKKHLNSFFGLNTFLDVIEIPKPKRKRRLQNDSWSCSDLQLFPGIKLKRENRNCASKACLSNKKTSSAGFCRIGMLDWLFHLPALSIGQKTERSLLRVFVELLQLHFHKCCLPLESLQLRDRSLEQELNYQVSKVFVAGSTWSYKSFTFVECPTTRQCLP